MYNNNSQTFHVAQPLPALEEFYGRAYERSILSDRISKRSSTALVGEYRVGKSWLMQYVEQSASTYALSDSQVRVGRLSATSPRCQTLDGFVDKALEVLQWHSQRPNSSGSPLKHLTIKVDEMRGRNIVPVLCIDEFDGLIGRPDFDRHFLEGLRAIAQDEGLVLITASRRPLHTIIGQMASGSSPLFNIMLTLTLRPFTETEAREFIDKKGQQSGLIMDEREFFLDCSAILQANGKKSWPPLRLQLAGYLLLKDKYVPAQNSYDLNDPTYQKAFKKSLDGQYRRMVKRP